MKNRKVLIVKVQKLSKSGVFKKTPSSLDLQLLRKAWGNMPPDMSVYEKRIFLEIAEKILIQHYKNLQGLRSEIN